MNWGGLKVSMKNDLISRKWLTDAIRNRKTYLSYEDAKDVIDLIDNAPTVDINTKLSVAYLKGRMQGQSDVRPQGEWYYNNEQLKDPEFRKEYEKLCDENKQKGGEG